MSRNLLWCNAVGCWCNDVENITDGMMACDMCCEDCEFCDDSFRRKDDQ
jgi:hypothetical protein